MDLTKGQKSFIKFVYVMSNIAVGISAILAVALLLFGMFRILTDISSEEKSLTYPGFKIFKADLQPIDETKIEKKSIFHLTDIEAELGIGSKSIEPNLLQSIITIIIFVGQFLLIFLIRNILKTLVEENPFTYINIKRLKQIAAIILFGPLLINILTILFVVSNKGNELIYGQFKVFPKSIFEFNDGLYYAAIIYLFALAFQKGFKLEKEQELTV